MVDEKLHLQHNYIMCSRFGWGCGTTSFDFYK